LKSFKSLPKRTPSGQNPAGFYGTIIKVPAEDIRIGPIPVMGNQGKEIYVRATPAQRSSPTFPKVKHVNQDPRRNVQKLFG